MDLFQPWSASPLPVDVAVAEQAVAVCRLESGFDLKGARVATVDMRGEGRIDLVLVLPAGTTRCGLLGSTGSLDYADGGEMADLPRDPGAVVPGAARLRSVDRFSDTPFGGATSSRTVAVGEAPAGVAAVDLVLAGRGRVRAALNNGWFSAWWPTDEKVVSVVTIDAAGDDMVAVKP